VEAAKKKDQKKKENRRVVLRGTGEERQLGMGGWRPQWNKVV